jgi:hypothetical protein
MVGMARGVVGMGCIPYNSFARLILCAPYPFNYGLISRSGNCFYLLSVFTLFLSLNKIIYTSKMLFKNNPVTYTIKLILIYFNMLALGYYSKTLVIFDV